MVIHFLSRKKDFFLADVLVSYQILFHIFRLFLVIVLDGRVSLVAVAPSCSEKEVLLFFLNLKMFLRKGHTILTPCL